MFVAAEAEAFAANSGCLCLETSAKDAVNIGRLFTMISKFYHIVCYWWILFLITAEAEAATEVIRWLGGVTHRRPEFETLYATVVWSWCQSVSVIFVNKNENCQKRKNNELVNAN